MTSPPSPAAPRPRLPSRRTGAVLAALMLAAGTALGALIGPGPAVSLASSQRAAALARILGLVALDDSAGASALLNPATHTHSPASTATTNATAGAGARSETGAGGSGGGASAGNSTGSARAGGSAGTAGSAGAGGSGGSSGAASPTAGGGTTHSGGEAGEAKPKPLPPIAHVWLIVVPYGQSFANVMRQPTAAPYIDNQLLAQGTLLSADSALAGSQFAGAAALLSGQQTAAAEVLSPAACATTSGAPAGSGSPATTGSNGGAGAGEGTQCPSGEPASVQAADDYVREVVSRIVASSEYREHGLIAITFAPASTPTASASAVDDPGVGSSILGAHSRAHAYAAANGTLARTSTAAAPAGRPLAGASASEPATQPAPAAPSAAILPPGTTTTSLSATGAPAGVLLLSPFLRHPGGRSTAAFVALAPRKSLEAVLTLVH
jgi:hypothetical protein